MEKKINVTMPHVSEIENTLGYITWQTKRENHSLQPTGIRLLQLEWNKNTDLYANPEYFPTHPFL